MKHDGLGPRIDPALQALVNLTFINLVSDPFLNSDTLMIAANAAARQLGIESATAEKMLAGLLKTHAQIQERSGIKGFMP